jgi:hypothetical protein
MRTQSRAEEGNHMTSDDPSMPPAPPGFQPPRKSHRTRNIILGLVGGLAVVIVIATVASNGGNGNSPASNSLSNPPAVQATPSAPSSPAATTAPSLSPTAPPSPTPPPMTVSQQQAVDSAQSYLQDEPGFSYQGLIDQLDSSYGEGFSVADATFAVNYIAPAGDTTFWDAQAVDSAQSYMKNEPGWSACGLVQQLDSSYGEQFTQAEAEYAAQQVGLGSC